ncbi:MAG: hypothetical protein PHX07_02955 [Candidatus Marinimicrobia bacterium]|jgi:hypothetical protein|nr:hypothetical protein [Candidatus Neomarinimicrobiota bacterium]MDD4961176.1 hypothetical protein [Candidatus Neomarinimicrobiota bacterium]MDD5709878.1 hypothetical protein [Candidatus Neomarinimicrobiota bacterium]MDX9777199.1 hypothetical protein [bacterium]
MKPKRLLQEISGFLEKQNIDIIYGTGSFNGGFCIINENPVIVVNRRSPLEEQLRIFVSVILEQGFDYSGLKNEIRQYIERFVVT